MRELFDQWIGQIPEYWGVASEDIESEPEGGRLPMGASVRPRSGPNWVVVGDAAGSVNPFNGDGIEPALSNGRLAATVISDAIHSGDGLELRQYERQLASKYDHYYRLGRLATKALGRPGLMRRLHAARDSIAGAHGTGNANLYESRKQRCRWDRVGIRNWESYSSARPRPRLTDP